MSETESRNEQIVKSFFEALSAGDLGRVRSMLHEQATWTVMAKAIPGAGEKKGHRGIIDEFLSQIRGLFQDGDPKLQINSIVSKGPLVAAETRGYGHLKNGKEYDNRYAWMVEIKDGKVFAVREYMDSYDVSTLMM